MPARSLKEQRDERKITLRERTEMVANLAHGIGSEPMVIWCHYNEEGDALTRAIADAEQVSGSMSEEAKEERLLAFTEGQLRVLVIKPKIGCFGLNWQHCNHVATFASHSWEQYYQAVRRCWRFGQQRPVTVSVISTEGEAGVLANLRRKATQADRMFERLCHHMQAAIHIDHARTFNTTEELPRWLAPNK